MEKKIWSPYINLPLQRDKKWLDWEGGKLTLFSRQINSQLTP